MDTDKDTIINHELRIDGVYSTFAAEIYLKVDELNVIYALHPIKLSSAHCVILDEWPTPALWLEIFSLYGIYDVYSFCVYVNRISNSGIIQKKPQLLFSLLQSYGYSMSRFNDVTFIGGLSGYNKQLFIDKHVPVKLLRIFNENQDELWQGIVKFLVLKELNGNVVKEIITNWIDLSKDTKNAVIQKYEEVCNRVNKNSQINIAEEFRNIMYVARFPEITSLRNKLDFLKTSLSSKIKIKTDSNLENNHLMIYSEVESLDELEIYINEINKHENIIILEQMINLLNQA
ncbi:MAG: hypothetical protein OEV78_10550 [Spirochaetia bacterium]|nr:hypothetical protein [Spirochaetia bacterium]